MFLFFILKNTAIEDKPHAIIANICLLYTSDAADDRISVDLGGRRIIKKKKEKKKKHKTNDEQ
ncbi:hypothetical protein, partial [Escherichia coli]|uniref:hypothetical protein n=1 Tax=Escherichia coli TaxID=562 RepID=UPI0022AF9BA3